MEVWAGCGAAPTFPPPAPSSSFLSFEFREVLELTNERRKERVLVRGGRGARAYHPFLTPDRKVQPHKLLLLDEFKLVWHLTGECARPPLGSRSRISASITCSPGHCRPAGGNMEAEILREPWEDLEVPQT